MVSVFASDPRNQVLLLEVAVAYGAVDFVLEERAPRVCHEGEEFPHLVFLEGVQSLRLEEILVLLLHLPDVRGLRSVFIFIKTLEQLLSLLKTLSLLDYLFEGFEENDEQLDIESQHNQLHGHDDEGEKPSETIVAEEVVFRDPISACECPEEEQHEEAEGEHELDEVDELRKVFLEDVLDQNSDEERQNENPVAHIVELDRGVAIDFDLLAKVYHHNGQDYVS